MPDPATTAAPPTEIPIPVSPAQTVADAAAKGTCSDDTIRLAIKTQMLQVTQIGIKALMDFVTFNHQLDVDFLESKHRIDSPEAQAIQELRGDMSTHAQQIAQVASATGTKLT